MKICCSITITDDDLPKDGVLEWVKSTFDVKENAGRFHFKVDSTSNHASELVLRLKSSFDRKPLTFFNIEYSRADIDNAPLLHLSCSSYIAQIGESSSLDVVDLDATTALIQPKFLGGMRPFPQVIAVNEVFKNELNKANLIGLQWVKLHASNATAEHKVIWRMHSSIVLPPSPIPLYNSFFTAPFDGDYTKGCMVDSPYRDVELAYTKEEIAAMEPFDIAMTREYLGNYVGGCFQQIVITQNFRKILQAKKNLRNLSFTPVRLLEPGEPAVRDPFEALAHGS